MWGCARAGGPIVKILPHLIKNKSRADARTKVNTPYTNKQKDKEGVEGRSWRSG